MTIRGGCGRDGRHDCPAPTEGRSTSCPCGAVTRHPGPAPKGRGAQ